MPIYYIYYNTGLFVHNATKYLKIVLIIAIKSTAKLIFALIYWNMLTNKYNDAYKRHIVVMPKLFTSKLWSNNYTFGEE